MNHPSPTRIVRRGEDAAPSQSGFALIAILVLVGVISMVAATFSRHVLVHARSVGESEESFEAGEIINSQIDFVLQSQSSGTGVVEATMLHAVKQGSLSKDKKQKNDTHGVGHTLLLDVSEVTGDRVSMLAQVLSAEGSGATRLIEVGRAPRMAGNDPDTLPQLDAQVLEDLLDDSDLNLLVATTDTTLSHQDIQGIVVVKNGVELTLEDVVIEGSIISGDVLLGWSLGAFDADTAPTVTTLGTVRIRPGSDLEGVAVLLPDGVFRAGDSQSRLTLEGDVVAHDVMLDCVGSVHGNVAAASGAVLGAQFEQVGLGRGNDPTPEALDTQEAFDTTFLAFVPRYVSIDDLGAMTGFQMPPQGGGEGSSTQQDGDG